MTPDDLRATFSRAGITPTEDELPGLCAAWGQLESGHLAVLRLWPLSPPAPPLPVYRPETPERA
jgi:hypothetical protein